MKKRGFGEGMWNGFGGKVEVGESVIEAAMREVMEEVGLTVVKMKESGVLEFTFKDEPSLELEVHVFVVTAYTGIPLETDEMHSKWFTFNDIPYDTMWPDDKHWLPFVLDGKKIRASFQFDRPTSSEYRSNILNQTISFN
jgi:8-oxo-dGTP pyrophosphatase MutT (NUDIX family)